VCQTAGTLLANRTAIPVNDATTELLVRLISRHQEGLYRHIFALLPHEEDARDVLQETAVALFRKFADYDPAKPFLPWAYRFAELEVMKQRERNRRGSRLLDPELIQRLAREREALEPELQDRLRALDLCLDNLSPADRELIRRRYHGKTRIEDLVNQSGGSRRTLFRNLDRVRRALLECIIRRVAADAP
jgi:RNA polymerase sigma-70 factor (ECF subfamily)